MDTQRGRRRRASGTKGPAAIAWLSLMFGTVASADAIRGEEAAAPMSSAAAGLGGTLRFRLDRASASGGGVLELADTPLAIADGRGVELDVAPDADGVRRQTLTVALDGDGRVRGASGNVFELRGRVVAGADDHRGLLLRGVPTALAPAAGGVELRLTITGGALARLLGPDATLRIRPAPGAGPLPTALDRDFDARGVEADTLAEPAGPPTLAAGFGAGVGVPVDVAEPGTLAVWSLIIGHWSLVVRRRMRARREEG